MIADAEKQKLYDQISAEYGERIHNFVINHTGSNNCEDLEQEIRLQIWASLESYEGKSSLKTWAFGIAINTTMYFNRTEKREEKGKKDLAKEMTSTCTVPDTVGVILAKQLLRTLDKEERTLFLLILDGWTYHEISEATSFDEGALPMQVSRLRSKFRKIRENGHG